VKDYADIDSKFRFVILAAKRAKELLKGAKPKVKSNSKNLIRIAQEEVQQGLIEFELIETPEEEVSEDAKDLILGEELGMGPVIADSEKERVADAKVKAEKKEDKKAEKKVATKVAKIAEKQAAEQAEKVEVAKKKAAAKKKEKLETTDKKEKAEKKEKKEKKASKEKAADIKETKKKKDEKATKPKSKKSTE